jgi:transcriptional regulator with XRE-family HTH domain
MSTIEGEENMQTELSQFEPGPDGYPVPGKVIKYYRERMAYRDKDGKIRHWTQADLARQLGLTEIMVNLMENKNQGLDSIERRRALVSILRIPPILLGLGSLDLIVEVATGQEQQSTGAKKGKVSREVIEQYQKVFTIYDTLFAGGLTYASLPDIERWTKQVERSAKDATGSDKNVLLRILWDYESLCTKVYGSDVYDYARCFEHADNATEIATLLNDRDLQAASLFASGLYRLRQGRFGLAKVDIEGALMYAKGALPQTKGQIYSLAAFSQLHEDKSSLLALKLLDEAEKYAGVASETRTLKFGKGPYFLGRADALLILQRPAKALELLDEAQKNISPSKKRYHIFMDILRAKCYIELKSPGYEEATRLLQSAVETSQEMKIERHLDHITRLYKRLAQSSYGNSPDVVELGIQLRQR